MRRFVKKHQDLEPDVRETIKTLSADAFQPQLETHKLTGVLKDLWACSAGYDLRIVFEFTEFEGKEAIVLINLGTHDEVY